MILYLDTSALVKLYVEEPGTPEIAQRVETSDDGVVTARVAYAEARAAFARYRREGRLTASMLRTVVTRLDGDWSHYSVVDVTESLVRRAGALAERHGLRGFDAIHLAAALEVRGPGVEVEFSCFDRRLTAAARRERLRAPVFV